MRKALLTSIALVPLVAACGGGLSVGVGVGGGSGNVGVGASATVPVTGGERSGPPRLTVSMFKIDATGVGPEIGTLLLYDGRGGLRIEPALGGLPPGDHGFHLHENPNCGPGLKDGKMQAGMAAGGHYDPNATGQHAGPFGNGHRGDLPVLVVDKDGNAAQAMNALHLSVNDVRGRAFVVHEGADNYADQPRPLGGGGARIACGVVSMQTDEAP
jgi:Cu-Zn family superoxide dismutase